MIHIGARVDNCDPASCAGIACRPRSAGANHLIGGSHIGIRRLLLLHHAGLIPVLKNDLLHTGNFLDFLDLPILDICRNYIGCQCHIPNNIQLCTIQCLLGDGGSHAVLLLLQLPPILHGAAISSCNLIRGKALFQGRGVL